MPWVPLIMGAVSMLQQQQDKKKSRQAALDKQLMDISEHRAAELGGSPYSAMTDNFILSESARRRSENEREGNSAIGTALQAYSGLSGGADKKAGLDKAFFGSGSAASDRAGYEASKLSDGGGGMGGGEAVDDVDKALGAFDAYTSRKSLDDDLDLLDDPWKRR